jgi:hypothetical protein
MTSIIVNQNYGHNLIKYFEYVKQKKESPGNNYPGCVYVVPRDRIELPTRGFSDHVLITLDLLLPDKNIVSFPVFIPMHPTLPIHPNPDGM